MSDEIEAMGAVVEGGLIAKAVEDERFGNARGKGGNCLNCGAIVTSSYCPECGQPLHIHRSLGAFWHDILHGVLHFEGKLWRTLPLLVWKPGDLTRRYIHGERAKFISPMALFLFSVFMMFAVFSFIGTPFTGASDLGAGKGAGSFPEAVAIESSELEERIKAAEMKLAAQPEGLAEADALREEILDYKRGRNVMATMTISELPYPEVGLGDGADATDSVPRIDTDGNIIRSTNNFQIWEGWEDSALGRKLMGGINQANKNPSLLIYKLKANGYKFAWLLIPISLPFVWLATIGRRGYHFYDHAVFTTYSISFMSLLFISCAILAAMGVSVAVWGWLLLIYPIFHMYRQLRHAYQMSRPEALIRVTFLLTFTVISLTSFFAILLTLGILG